MRLFLIHIVFHFSTLALCLFSTNVFGQIESETPDEVLNAVNENWGARVSDRIAYYAYWDGQRVEYDDVVAQFDYLFVHYLDLGDEAIARVSKDDDHELPAENYKIYLAFKVTRNGTYHDKYPHNLKFKIYAMSLGPPYGGLDYFAESSTIGPIDDGVIEIVELGTMEPSGGGRFHETMVLGVDVMVEEPFVKTEKLKRLKAINGSSPILLEEYQWARFQSEGYGPETTHWIMYSENSEYKTLEELEELRSGISGEEETDGKKPEPSASRNLIIGGIAGGGTLAILFFVFLKFRKKRKERKKVKERVNRSMNVDLSDFHKEFDSSSSSPIQEDDDDEITLHI